MNLPSIFDPTAIVGIGALTMIVIQYIKEPIPEKLIRWLTVLVGILVSFIWFYKPEVGYDYIAVIVNGAFAAFGADTGYNFLSASKSVPFTLPGKTESSK